MSNLNDVARRYSSKASRTGLRVCDLAEWDHFETLYRNGLVSKRKRFGDFPCVCPRHSLSMSCDNIILTPAATTSRQNLSSTRSLQQGCSPLSSIPFQSCTTVRNPPLAGCVTISHPRHPALMSGKKVMVEGANALMLDIDFGTYPYTAHYTQHIHCLLVSI